MVLNPIYPLSTRVYPYGVPIRYSFPPAFGLSPLGVRALGEEDLANLAVKLSSRQNSMRPTSKLLFHRRIVRVAPYCQLFTDYLSLGGQPQQRAVHLYLSQQAKLAFWWHMPYRKLPLRSYELLLYPLNHQSLPKHALSAARPR